MELKVTDRLGNSDPVVVYQRRRPKLVRAKWDFLRRIRAPRFQQEQRNSLSMRAGAGHRSNGCKATCPRGAHVK